MRRFPHCLAAALALACAPVAAETLALQGTVHPPLERGFASISAVRSPFYAEAPVRGSEFLFRDLEPGGYTLTVIDPRWGVTRQTVQVTPSFADSSGTVRVEVGMDRSEAARSRRLERQGTVSAAQLQVTPKAKSLVRQARARLSAGSVEEGTALLRKAVELSPTFAEVWNELGTIAYKAGRYAEAAEHFRTALEHEPLSFAPTVNLGGALLSLGEYEEALSYNLMARSLQPEDALANSQLGMNFYYKKLLPQAVEHLQRAKQADPSHFSHPQLFLAEIYANQGKIQEARAELEELARLHPDAPVAALAARGLRQLQGAEPGR